MARIGIYGGSFNPVHYGHVNVARRAIAELGLDQLIVIPASVSPFKTDTPTIFNRLEMLDDAFSGMEKTVVDRREIERGGVSYAIDTVREIASENPGAELYFIIGEDSVEGLPRWKDYEELKRIVSFKAFARTEESSSAIRALFEGGKVRFNPDEKTVRVVKDGLRRKGGFCPCRLPKTPEFFCPCDEFKGQLADPGYHGLCHCRLYLKP
jgi:nicotinate-nucleotide adenylyltransferase